MNHPIIYQLYYAFRAPRLLALRFNFRGVGRSQGAFDHGQGELSDAAAALDWAQTINPEAKAAGSPASPSRLDRHAASDAPARDRRPSSSICPPANLYDFSFLAPCPSSGLIIHGDKDAVGAAQGRHHAGRQAQDQKGIVIEQKVVQGANHFFDGKVEPLLTSIAAYLDKRLKSDRKPTAA